MSSTDPLPSWLIGYRMWKERFHGGGVIRSAAEMELRVVRDLRVAYLSAMTAYDRMGLTQQLLAQTRSAMDLAQTRYDLGLGSIVEISQAQLGVTSAEMANASALYDYQGARVAVDYQSRALR